MEGYQRKYLRSLAHHLDAMIHIGKNNLTDGVIHSINDAFNTRELMKIRIHDKKNKNVIMEQISNSCKCHIVGEIGNIIICYREHIEKELRKIKLPKK